MYSRLLHNFLVQGRWNDTFSLLDFLSTPNPPPKKNSTTIRDFIIIQPWLMRKVMYIFP